MSLGGCIGMRIAICLNGINFYSTLCGVISTELIRDKQCMQDALNSSSVLNCQPLQQQQYSSSNLDNIDQFNRRIAEIASAPSAVLSEQWFIVQ
jgi:hypothetical protein